MVNVARRLLSRIGLFTRRFRTPSFRLPLLFAAAIVASMFIMDAALMWQGWNVARSALLASARENNITMGRVIDERARSGFNAASGALNRLTDDPLIEAKTLPDRLARVGAMANTLSQIPVTSAIYLAYPDGEFLLLRHLRTAKLREFFQPPDGAEYVLQTITKDGRGAMVGEWRFYDGNVRLLQMRPKPDYVFNPRDRSWYTHAEVAPEKHLTGPYPFFTTGAPGVTFSQKPRTGDVVVGVDLELSDLSAQLDQLRPTPHSQLAITAADGVVVAFTDPKQLTIEESGELRFRKLKDLDSPVLAMLAANMTRPRQPQSLDVDGTVWFGIDIPLSAIAGSDLHFYIATPDSDMLQSVRSGIARQAAGAGLFTVALMVGGWMAGRRLGRDLTDLTSRAHRLSHFDFRRSLKSQSLIREVRELESVLDVVCGTIGNFLATTETIGREQRLDHMVGRVLRKIVETTGCSFGAVYLLNEAADTLQLASVAQEPPSAADVARGAPPAVMPEPELPLSAASPGQPPLGEIEPGAAQLALPLTDRQNRPIGLLLLNYPFDLWHEGSEFRTFVEKLSGALSAAVETRRLIETQQELLDGFIRLIAAAIDAKSPYTGGHCLRVPELATMVIDRLCRETDGPYRNVHLSEDERYAFHLGAWLHDCGKVTSPEYVIDKATKLETIHNRIHEIRTRFEVLWRDAEIAHLRRALAGEDGEASARRMQEAQAALRDDFAFVAQCNVGGEFLTDAAIARLNAIAGRSWMRHFDDRLGLSREEQARRAGLPEHALPVTEPLLCDRPEHKVPWGGRRPPVERGDPGNVYGFDMKLPAYAQNLGELHNLSIRRGTLTDEERFKVNDHIVQTYIMLRSLPWPTHLKRVPEIASTHHERMDGKGYPRHIAQDGLKVEDRVLALADVFEALTAGDRPYKPAKSLSESLRIMVMMGGEGHLDPELLRYFLESGLWDEYAARFLQPEQRDPVDVPALLEALQRSQRPPAPGASRPG